MVFVMEKRHFMATHTWVSDEARDQLLAATSGMSDEDFFASLKTENAETLAHWMGQGDFFFCHWYATDADAIFESLEASGMNDLIVTMPSEMQRYISCEKTSGQILINPFNADRSTDG